MRRPRGGGLVPPRSVPSRQRLPRIAKRIPEAMVSAWGDVVYPACKADASVSKGRLANRGERGKPRNRAEGATRKGGSYDSGNHRRCDSCGADRVHHRALQQVGKASQHGGQRMGADRRAASKAFGSYTERSGDCEGIRAARERYPGCCHAGSCGGG